MLDLFLTVVHIPLTLSFIFKLIPLFELFVNIYDNLLAIELLIYFFITLDAS